MAKKQTWQDLQARGGPYTSAELHILWDRPGVSKVAASAWRCDTCGDSKGMITSAELMRHLRGQGKLQEEQIPAAPPEVAALQEWAKHTERVWQDIDNDLQSAYAELTNALIARRKAEHTRVSEGEGLGANDPKHLAGIAQAEARIVELTAARSEAACVRSEALEEYNKAWSAFRKSTRARDEQPTVARSSALERWLSGRKSA